MSNSRHRKLTYHPVVDEIYMYRDRSVVARLAGATAARGDREHSLDLCDKPVCVETRRIIAARGGRLCRLHGPKGRA